MAENRNQMWQLGIYLRIFFHHAVLCRAMLTLRACLHCSKRPHSSPNQKLPLLSKILLAHKQADVPRDPSKGSPRVGPTLLESFWPTRSLPNSLPGAKTLCGRRISRLPWRCRGLDEWTESWRNLLGTRTRRVLNSACTEEFAVINGQ
jgi:hypothetical protein